MKRKAGGMDEDSVASGFSMQTAFLLKKGVAQSGRYYAQQNQSAQIHIAQGADQPAKRDPADDGANSPEDELSGKAFVDKGSL